MITLTYLNKLKETVGYNCEVYLFPFDKMGELEIRVIALKTNKSKHMTSSISLKNKDFVSDISNKLDYFMYTTKDMFDKLDSDDFGAPEVI